jgi:two-component system LytT family response regulator
MEKLRVLIVDDEPPAREGLRLLLARDPQVEIVGECANGYEALTLLRQARPDLVFLDAQMPELDGFDVLERVGSEAMPAVIFVTAYDRYALQAFEVQALDYLLKPFSDERFARALQRAKRQLAQEEVTDVRERLQGLLAERRQARGAAAVQLSSAASPYLERLMIKAGGRVCFLGVEEIDWIEAANYYVILHAAAKTHLLRETITNLAARLDPQKFLRIHRSTIVNLAKVKDWQPQGHGESVVILQNGTRLKLSRRRRKMLEDMIESLP